MVLLMFHPVAGVAAVSNRRQADCQACYRNRVVVLANSPQACSQGFRCLVSKRNPTYLWLSSVNFIRFMGSAAICTNSLLKARKKRRCHLDISTGTQRLRIKATSIMEQGTWLQTWEEESQNFGTGPLSGDLAEIEAFCRIHRIAEQLHKAVMDSLRSLGRDEITNVQTGGFSSSLEEKVVAGLACIGATLQQGRLEILGAWAKDPKEEDEKLPRVTRFRSKLRSCSKSLQTSLQSLLAAKGEQNLAVYRILQRFNSICLDAGFPRPDGVPCHDHIPNFATVKLRSLKEQNDEPVDFWRGGQLTEEGLEWLLDNKFKTIVDLRAEDPENGLAESALMEAEASGIIKRVKIPVQVETAPTMQQVQEFARLVSDSTNRPLFLHSYAGIVRTSAMISRWREFVSRGGLEAEDADSRSVLTQKRELNELWSCETADSKNPILDLKLLEPSTSAPGPSDELNVARKSPFQAQMPGPNVFSRKVMSSFFQQKRTTPSTFLTRSKKSVVLISSSYNGSTASSGEPNGQAKENNAESSELQHSSSGSSDGQATRTNNGGLTQASSDDDHPVVEGDMCASKTGVVRLQSRKKAEMYLVRTDGFSCTREKVMESTLAFTHPSTQQQMLMWKTAPKTVLLLKKLGDELMEEAKQVASFLYHQEGMNVMVEPDVHDRFARYPGFGYVQTFYNHDIGELHERVDFVVCLGGDGVILHASNLFRSSVPPVVSFNLGSLGFLTAHPFEDFKQDLRAIIHGNRRIEGVYVTLRMRLRCEIFRDGQPIQGKVFEVLNEVVVDRGSNPYLCKIECYERNRLITKVQADGVLVATPTGSTAYSTAAGGSMVHPNVPCMLFTPICPHSLSFRPVILPDSAILELKVPTNSRSNAWVSFDGKKRQQLSKGDSVRIYMCQNPVPTVNKSDHTSDWFRSLDRCFNWSDRKEQKPLTMTPFLKMLGVLHLSRLMARGNSP